MRRLRWLVIGGLLMVWSGGIGELVAAEQEGPDTLDLETPGGAGPKSIEERVDELEQKQRISDRLRELGQQREEQRAKEAPVVGADQDGFFLRSASGKFELRFRGYGQVQGRFFLGDKDQAGVENSLSIRRVRPIFEGRLYRYVTFKVMPDFQQGRVLLFDGYLGFDYWSAAQLRAGKFKPSVGLEMWQSAADLLFVERGLTANLVPNRDIGAMVYGHLFNKRLDYKVGIFNGAGDNNPHSGTGSGSDTDGGNDFDTNNDKDYVISLLAQPFRSTQMEWLEGLQVGVAGTWGRDSGNSPRGFLRTPSMGRNDIRFFRYLTGVAITGDRWRVVPQVYYAWGPFSLLGEYVWNSQDLRALGGQEERITNRAWQVAMSYVLTGEAASFNGVKPWRLFNPAQGAWGAVEVAARYGEVLIDQDAFPLFADPTASARKARVWTVGINWHLAHRVKAQFNYERGIFDGGAPNNQDFEQENAVLTQMQVAW